MADEEEEKIVAEAVVITADMPDATRIAMDATALATTVATVARAVRMIVSAILKLASEFSVFPVCNIHIHIDI